MTITELIKKVFTDEKKRSEMKARAIILVTVISFAFFAVILRLVDIMLLNHERFAAKATLQQIGREVVPVKRGIIFDRTGRKLAINIHTKSIYSNPSEVSSPEDTAVALSRILQQKPDTTITMLSADSRFSWVYRQLGIEYAQMIKDLNIAGIGFIPEMMRYYPGGSLASHIIGFVGIDNQGLEGIELRYDRYLATGKEKWLYMDRDARGNILSGGYRKGEIQGNNLVLTISEGLQHIVETNLDAAVSEWEAASATAIMMNPHTGEILAMANRPTFDLNNPSGTETGHKRNRAITDIYEQGSTFKIVVAAAAIEEGIMDQHTEIDCSAGYIKVGGRKMRDACRHLHRVLTLKEVMQKSSNVGTLKVALELGEERLYEYTRRFGFGSKTGIDLVGEVSGWVRPPEYWSRLSIGSVAIGYEVAATPMQVLRAYAVVANGGYLVRPHVVSEILSPCGKVIYEANVEKQRIISEKTVTSLREMLEAVTEEGGTAISASIDGNQVAGKTGTAQMVDPATGRHSSEKLVSSFVGFAPAYNPAVAVIVVIHEPQGAEVYGGIVAAPVFREIVNASLTYLGVPMDNFRE
ncbi:penicillin-binding protein 2 [Thermodesulfovibrionales bacterium]|nr:penicillin-binding protein 2 [Thermodesulfovibrionales bacterium]